MKPWTELTRRLGTRHPIIQGPMNGASPPALVKAVSQAGGLGSWAATLMSPQQILDGVAALRAELSGGSGALPFNVNLFILPPTVADSAEVARAVQRLQPFHDEQGLPPLAAPGRFGEPFADQLAALIEAAPPVASFTFGVLDAATVARFHRAGSLVVGTATTTAEGLAWQEAGADIVVAQGTEAGGHRATFIGDFDSACVGLMALVPQMAARLSVPVVAAGAIMDGRAMAAAMLLGAQGAQLGTAFLACPESGIAPAWRDRLPGSPDDSTRLTRAFSGRPARGIVNDFMRRMQPHEAEVPPYPIQNALTATLRREATQRHDAQAMSLWAGQAAGLARPMPAADLVATLARELDDAVRGMAAWGG